MGNALPHMSGALTPRAAAALGPLHCSWVVRMWDGTEHSSFAVAVTVEVVVVVGRRAPYELTWLRLEYLHNTT